MIQYYSLLTQINLRSPNINQVYLLDERTFGQGLVISAYNTLRSCESVELIGGELRVDLMKINKEFGGGPERVREKGGGFGRPAKAPCPHVARALSLAWLDKQILKCQ